MDRGCGGLHIRVGMCVLGKKRTRFVSSSEKYATPRNIGERASRRKENVNSLLVGVVSLKEVESKNGRLVGKLREVMWRFRENVRFYIIVYRCRSKYFSNIFLNMVLQLFGGKYYLYAKTYYSRKKNSTTFKKGTLLNSIFLPNTKCDIGFYFFLSIML